MNDYITYVNDKLTFEMNGDGWTPLSPPLYKLKSKMSHGHATITIEYPLFESGVP